MTAHEPAPIDPASRPATDVGADAHEPAAPSGPGWRDGAAWALLLTRWIAAQIVIGRVEAFRTVAFVIAAVALPVGAVSLVADPNWPWITLAVVLLVLGGGAALLCTALMAVVRRLALPKKAKPLAALLVQAKGELLGQLTAAGAPVTAGTALRFVVALARGKAPYRTVTDGLVGVVRHLDAVLDPAEVRAALAQAR